MLIKRRSFLQGLAGAACTPLFLEAMSAEAATSGDLIVVVVGLNGGNDGLNTVIPLKQYGLYNTLRSPVGAGSIAYSQSSLALTAFDSNPAHIPSASTQYAFAPAMTAMRQLYATGKLAVINGIGLPSAELAPQSHFAVADSAFNESELLALGYEGTAVVPLLIDMHSKSDEPDADLPACETINGVKVYRVASTRFGRTTLPGL